MDIRPWRTAVKIKDPKFSTLAADLAATIRSIPKEDLLSQEVRQQRRALRLAWSAAALLLVLAAVAAFQSFEAESQRRRASA